MVKNKVALKNTKTSLQAFQSSSLPLYTDPSHVSKHTQIALFHIIVVEPRYKEEPLVYIVRT